MSTLAAAPAKSTQRIQLESLLRDFQSKLGNDWETYHEALSSFLVGRLSRQELVTAIAPLMKNGLLKYHNKLLLFNFASTLQDNAPELAGELSSFWNKRNAKSRGVKSNQYEKFKQNIMGLPLKERRRIRAITKDSGKRDKLSASITLTRQALLPKIPMLQDKEQQQMQVNNLVQWQQDVMNGINTPLASSSYELPDADTLSRRVVMTSREHGLTGGINARVFDVISLGLEAHLKNVLECAVDTVRYRKRKYESVFLPTSNSAEAGGGSGVTADAQAPSTSRRRISEISSADVLGQCEARKDVIIGTEDMHNTLEMFPYLVEPGGPQVRLASLMLQNDDCVGRGDGGSVYELPPRPKADFDIATGKTGGVNMAAKTGEAKDATKLEAVGKTGELDKGGSKRKSVDANPVETRKENSHMPSGVKPAGPAKEPSHIGSVDELKWMLHDLITSS